MKMIEEIKKIIIRMVFHIRVMALISNFVLHSFIASSPLKKGGVEDFGSRDIGGGLALISGL